MSVYHDMDYFDNMDYDDCWRLIEKAEERQREDKAYLAYVNWLPHMEEDKRCSFEEFMKVRKVKVSTKPSEEIIKDVKKLREKFFNKPKR